MPSLIFTVIVLGTQVIALVLSVYGAFGADPTIGSIGWVRGLIIIAISLGTFFIIDVIKVVTISFWDKFANKSRNEFTPVPAFATTKNKKKDSSSKAAKFIQKQSQQKFHFGYDRAERRESASSIKSY
jgi:H+-transporting ATPase